jgi:ATP synthase F1 complex assembly factor 1
LSTKYHCRQGHKNVNDLQEAYKDKIERLRKQAIVPGATGPLGIDDKRQISSSIQESNGFGKPPPPPRPVDEPTASSSSSPPGVKTLSSFLDIKKTLQLPPKEIEYIWRIRHASNTQSIHFMIPAETYAFISLNAKKHPQFILPLPREEQGAEIHFLQFTWPHPDTVNILFTHLAEYKLRGEYATPHTTISLHEELLKEKGLVLGQGSVLENKSVTVDEAKWLMMCLQKFYGLQSVERQERKQLLEMFSNGDEGFDVQLLLDEAERI